MKLLIFVALFILAVNADHPGGVGIMCKMDCRPFYPCPELSCAPNEVAMRPGTCSCCNKCAPPIKRGNWCNVGQGLADPCESGSSCIGGKCERKPVKMCKMNCMTVRCARPICEDGEVEIKPNCSCCNQCVKPIQQGEWCMIGSGLNDPCDAGLSCTDGTCEPLVD